MFDASAVTLLLLSTLWQDQYRVTSRLLRPICLCRRDIVEDWGRKVGRRPRTMSSRLTRSRGHGSNISAALIFALLSNASAFYLPCLSPASCASWPPSSPSPSGLLVAKVFGGATPARLDGNLPDDPARRDYHVTARRSQIACCAAATQGDSTVVADEDTTSSEQVCPGRLRLIFCACWVHT